MTPDERRARAQRFEAWMERDGLGEGLAEIRSAYITRIAALDPTDSDFANKAKVLTIAARVVDQVAAQIQAVIGDGAVAIEQIARMERDKALSPERKRWI